METKGTPVIVRSSVRKQRFTVTVSNAIKQEHSDVGSSNIGLRNVQRMMQMMDGEMLLTKKTSSDSLGNHNISQNTRSSFVSESVSGVFEVTLWFPSDDILLTAFSPLQFCRAISLDKLRL